jgi:hypothetical protein
MIVVKAVTSGCLPRILAGAGCRFDRHQTHRSGHMARAMPRRQKLPGFCALRGGTTFSPRLVEAAECFVIRRRSLAARHREVARRGRMSDY